MRVLQEQATGNDGPIRGRFLILDVGDNKHSDALTALLGRATDALEVLALIRREHPDCVSVVNTNILAVEEHRATEPLGSPGDDGMDVEDLNPPAGMPALGPEPTHEPPQPQREPGNAPEGEPGNDSVTPDAERPPRREEGVVSDPDRYTAGPLTPEAGRLPGRGMGTLSNPDF